MPGPKIKGPVIDETVLKQAELEAQQADNQRKLEMAQAAKTLGLDQQEEGGWKGLFKKWGKAALDLVDPRQNLLSTTRAKEQAVQTIEQQTGQRMSWGEKTALQFKDELAAVGTLQPAIDKAMMVLGPALEAVYAPVEVGAKTLGRATGLDQYAVGFDSRGLWAGRADQGVIERQQQDLARSRESFDAFRRMFTGEVSPPEAAGLLRQSSYDRSWVGQVAQMFVPLTAVTKPLQLLSKAGGFALGGAELGQKAMEARLLAKAEKAGILTEANLPQVMGELLRHPGLKDAVEGYQAALKRFEERGVVGGGSGEPEPWELTSQEFADYRAGKLGTLNQQPTPQARSLWLNTHRDAKGIHYPLVRKAYLEGKPIPRKVLNGYPNLEAGFELRAQGVKPVPLPPRGVKPIPLPPQTARPTTARLKDLMDAQAVAEAKVEAVIRERMDELTGGLERKYGAVQALSDRLKAEASGQGAVLAGGPVAAARDRAFLELQVGTGSRAGPLADMTWKQLDKILKGLQGPHPENVVIVQGLVKSGKAAKAAGRGDQTEAVTLRPVESVVARVRAALEDYQTVLGKSFGEAQKAEKPFLSDFTGRLKTYTKAVPGLPDVAHEFRRMVAQDIYVGREGRAPGDLEAARQQLGHKDTDVTKKSYVKDFGILPETPEERALAEKLYAQNRPLFAQLEMLKKEAAKAKEERRAKGKTSLGGEIVALQTELGAALKKQIGIMGLHQKQLGEIAQSAPVWNDYAKKAAELAALGETQGRVGDTLGRQENQLRVVRKWLVEAKAAQNTAEAKRLQDAIKLYEGRVKNTKQLDSLLRGYHKGEFNRLRQILPDIELKDWPDIIRALTPAARPAGMSAEESLTLGHKIASRSISAKANRIAELAGIHLEGFEGKTNDGKFGAGKVWFSSPITAQALGNVYSDMEAPALLRRLREMKKGAFGNDASNEVRAARQEWLAVQWGLDPKIRAAFPLTPAGKTITAPLPLSPLSPLPFSRPKVPVSHNFQDPVMLTGQLYYKGGLPMLDQIALFVEPSKALLWITKPRLQDVTGPLSMGGMVPGAAGKVSQGLVFLTDFMTQGRGWRAETEMEKEMLARKVVWEWARSLEVSIPGFLQEPTARVGLKLGRLKYGNDPRQSKYGMGKYEIANLGVVKPDVGAKWEGGSDVYRFAEHMWQENPGIAESPEALMRHFDVVLGMVDVRDLDLVYRFPTDAAREYIVWLKDVADQGETIMERAKALFGYDPLKGVKREPVYWPLVQTGRQGVIDKLLPERGPHIEQVSPRFLKVRKHANYLRGIAEGEMYGDPFQAIGDYYSELYRDMIDHQFMTRVKEMGWGVDIGEKDVVRQQAEALSNLHYALMKNDLGHIRVKDIKVAQEASQAGEAFPGWFKKITEGYKTDPTLRPQLDSMLDKAAKAYNDAKALERPLGHRLFGQIAWPTEGYNFVKAMTEEQAGPISDLARSLRPLALMLRMFKAGFDLGGGGVHLFPLLASVVSPITIVEGAVGGVKGLRKGGPVSTKLLRFVKPSEVRLAAWSRAMEYSFLSLIDQRHYFAYMDRPENAQALARLTTLGHIPIGHSEPFELAEFGWTKLAKLAQDPSFWGGGIGKVPGAIFPEATHRFQNAFDSLLNVGRVELWKIMEKPGMTDAELATAGAIVSKMTGTFNQALHGTTPTQALYGSSLFFFARVYRGAVYGTVMDVGRGGMRTREGLRTISGVLALGGIFGSMAYLMGNKDAFDPRSPRFMTARVGGYNIGIGTAYYTATRLAANLYVAAATDKGGDKFNSVADNQIFRFVRSQLAPPTSLGLDAFFGRSYIGTALRDPGDHLPTAARKFGLYVEQTGLPFWLSSQNIREFTSGGGAAMGSEFFGARSFPLSLIGRIREAQDLAAKLSSNPNVVAWRAEQLRKGEAVSWSTLPNRLLQEQIEASSPELQQLGAELRRADLLRQDQFDSRFVQFSDVSKENRTQYNGEVAKLAQKWEVGWKDGRPPMTGREFRDALGDLGEQFRSRSQAIYGRYPDITAFLEAKRQDRLEAIGKAKEEGKFLGDLAYDLYVQTVLTNKGLLDEYGDRDQSAFEKAQTDWENVFSGDPGIIQYVRDRLQQGRDMPPPIKAYRDAQEQLKPYWNLHETLYGKGSRGWEAIDGLLARHSSIDKADYLRAFPQYRPYVRRWEIARDNYRRAHPGIDALLVTWYDNSPLTQAGREARKVLDSRNGSVVK